MSQGWAELTAAGTTEVVLVRADAGWQSVFLPQAPTPLSGDMTFLPADQVKPTKLSLTEAMRLVKSLGAERPWPGSTSVRLAAGDEPVAGPATAVGALRSPGLLQVASLEAENKSVPFSQDFGETPARVVVPQLDAVRNGATSAM